MYTPFAGSWDKLIAGRRRMWRAAPVFTCIGAFATGVSSACVGALLPIWTVDGNWRRLALANGAMILLTSAHDALIPRAQARIMAALAPRLFANLLTSRGEHMARALTDDARFASESVPSSVDAIARLTVGALVAAAIMARLSWRLTLLTLLVVPVHAGLRARRDAQGRARREAALAHDGFVAECVAQLATVKTLDATRWLAAKHGRLVEAMLGVHRQASLNHVPNLLAMATLGWAATGERLSPAHLVCVVMYQAQLHAACQTLVNECATLRSRDARDRWSSVSELLNQSNHSNHNNHSNQATQTQPLLLQDLQTHNDYRRLPSLLMWADRLAFRYSDKQGFVLHDVSLQLFRGERVAVIGSTGTGKSTLVKLILGLHLPTRGAVRFREGCVMSAVLQEPALFQGTIMDNLRMGCATASELDASAAARVALAHPFIMTLPLGYDTDTAAVALTRCETQRLAIARALLRRPDVVILDALEGDSEVIAINAFKHAGVLLFSNRPSQVATRVVHLSN